MDERETQIDSAADGRDDIDVVIAWVDGSDPDHAAKRARYQAQGQYHHNGTIPTRFMQNGELRFAVASLALYAPFVRRIHIITDGQDPRPLLEAVVARYPGLAATLSTVDHDVIFRGYEDLLPTFNSVSIETMMHRVPGLADRFVYMNDDFFLGAAVEPSDWFTAHGPVLHGEWKPFYEDRWSYQIKKLLDRNAKRARRPGFITSQQRAARLAWSGSRYLQIGHVPHPIMRATAEQAFRRNEAILVAQAGHRFRHHGQVSAVSLVNHTELEAGRATVLPNAPVGYLKPSEADMAAVKALLDGLEAHRYMAGCVQSVDEWGARERRYLLRGLQDHFLEDA